MTVGIFSEAYCQFIYTKQDSISNYFCNIYEEGSNGNLVISNTSFTTNAISGNFKFKSSFLKVNSSGVLLLNTPLDTNSYFSSALLPVNNSFLSFVVKCKGNNFSSVSYFPELIMYDQNYNVQKRLKLDSSYLNSIGTTAHIVKKNNSLYFGFYIDGSNKFKIYKTDFNLVRKDSIELIGSAVLDISNYGNELLISGVGFSFGSTAGNNQVVVLDTTFVVKSRFNLDSISSVNPGCYSEVGIRYYNTTLHEISSKKYLVSGYCPVTYTYNGVSCLNDVQNVQGIVLNNATIVNSNIFGKQFGINEMYGYYNSSHLAYGKLYSTGISGYDLMNPGPPQNTSTEIMVSKTDTMGNLKWIKYYGTPNYYYYPMGIYGTQDSGAVVCGMRYDLVAPTMTNACEGFVMKVDKDGIQQYLGVIENLEIKEVKVSCYPNPATNEIRFNLGTQKQVQINIYDVTGKQILFKKEYYNYETLSVAELPSGFYFYKVISEEIKAKGKFIKQ